MKKTILSIAAIIGISSLGYSQQEELKSAGSNIESKNYIAALDDLSKAKKKVTELMTDQLASVLPQKFGEFEMQKADGYGTGGQGASMNKTYAKPKPETSTDNAEAKDGLPNPGSGMDPMMMGEQEQIIVQITTSMMMANEVMNAHSMAEEGMGGQGVTALRVKGYRAILRSGGGEDMGMGQNSEEAQAIVGGAFISVRTQGLKEKGQAEKFLNLIDFDKLKGIVGE